MNKKITLFSFLILGFFVNLRAQQQLIPLEGNPFLQQQSRLPQNGFQNAKANINDTIDVNILLNRIIFQDDFSDYNGYPKNTLWADSFAYINNSFGRAPLTLGVATLDGINEKGLPYDFVSPTSYGQNDFLTSCPIDLDSIDLTDPNIDPIHLSFYYQPQGVNPFETQPGDSMILEFYDPETFKWTWVWGTDGEPVYSFRKKTIVVDESYHKNGFQFRFSNFGNRAGAVDHWHIDYVLMSSNTLENHNLIKDMAFRQNFTTLLDNYVSMPYWHYQPSDMASDLEINYYFFDNTLPKSPDIKSWMEITDSSNQSLLTLGTSSPEFSTGFIGPKTINWQFNGSGTNTYPASTKDGVTFFRYKTYFQLNGATTDNNLANDTMYENQIMGSYYAYDDGTAEAGFGVFGTGNRLAYEFDIGSVADTLTAVDIYFNPVVHDRSRETFKLSIWAAAADEGPGALFYENTLRSKPEYGKVNRFVRYEFEKKDIIVSGKFYVGWEKTSDERMNVGYDVNRDNQNKIYVDFGPGWQVSDNSGGVVPGSLMIRPVFRKFKDPLVSINEITTNDQNLDFRFYPNPAKDNLNIELTYSEARGSLSNEAKIIDLTGKVLISKMIDNSGSINLEGIPSGFYLLSVENTKGSTPVVKKLLITK